MRILGLDVGTKTVGVAISDEMGWTAQGLETIKINEERGQFGFDRISELVKQYNVDKIIVGLPKNMNGTIGPRGEACQQFAQSLRELLQLDVMMWDERLSTMAAERLLISADVSRKKRKQVIDKMAAVVILQGYLDSK
ncbi:Holliday junction resolvase RuvX [Bacillus pseudomycoides]|jgi:putative Holliday junction resolvase|uniref:Putative pre-16S rRNA nuclease n=1 Tax=Bacillus pseudomycoides TaxID=64104 RepID=A0A2A8B291_9BACI|nr:MULTISPECIES: Holliday junction resolvase RuvX [Bacillus]AIK38467.1 putative Holliday junction resolvase [Bacillus pseudomycoides]AJI16682.1 putative Holliday junction resolvase [Bacillus pseudomycoides]EEM03993.1 Holliday junction resolvase [Bacillus pseudomycoides]EEM09754.1 Holliday junction resolvase [Bacillus pseudomycoides]EEM15225.1 Holliday junction resolvase [Bacillus pseudomycoides DSM 12442]